VGAKPRKLAVDSRGNVWVYCWGPNLLFKLSPTGQPLNRVMIGKECRDMLVDATDHLWLASTGSNHVYEIQPNGQAATWFEVTSPACLALDADARLWVGTMAPGGTTNLFAFRQDGLEGYVTPGTPVHLALGQGNALFVSYADQPKRLSRLAADRRRLDDLWTGFSAADLQSEPGAVWVTNSTYDQYGAEAPSLSSPIANTVSRLSPGGRVLATYSAGSDAWQVKKAPNGELWVVNLLSARVTRLKP
jgi:sugar lactone lactonase YvrE